MLAWCPAWGWALKSLCEWMGMLWTDVPGGCVGREQEKAFRSSVLLAEKVFLWWWGCWWCEAFSQVSVCDEAFFLSLYTLPYVRHGGLGSALLPSWAPLHQIESFVGQILYFLQNSYQGKDHKPPALLTWGRRGKAPEISAIHHRALSNLLMHSSCTQHLTSILINLSFCRAALERKHSYLWCLQLDFCLFVLVWFPC